MAKQPKFNWKAFGKELRAWRENVEMGVRALAKEIGVSPATLSRAENGKPVTVPVYLALCNWMWISPNKYDGR